MMGDIVPKSVGLPDELITREQWVCWRFQERNGKETKVPVNPNNGSFGSTTNPESWTGFETAREYALDGAADGIGFVFTAEDPLVGVDLDDCRVPETGTITDEATDIVETLVSYTEVSPSGTGVHVILTGGLPGNRNRQGWVELYDEARFFTVTGDHVDGTPSTVEARPSEVETVYASYVAEPAEHDETTPPAESQSSPVSSTEADAGEATGDTGMDDGTTPGDGRGLSDDEVLERAQIAANGEKFSRLWRGQTTGYESHSEADMALCALLAFWTGGDSVQVDRLFRDSGLMREKWDERHFADGSTYGEKTIDRVLSGTSEFYEPYNSESASRKSPASGGTDESDGGSTAETTALEAEVATLTAREDEHLSVISVLQTQVERLETENERLRGELESARADASDDGSARMETSHSLPTRIRQWVGRWG